MKLETRTFIDTAGNAIGSSSIFVYAAGTLVLAPLYDMNGLVLANPLTTNASGQIAFQCPSGQYDFRDATGNLLQSRVQIYDISKPQEWVSASQIPVLNVLTPYTTVEDCLEALLLGNLGNTNVASTLPTGFTNGLAGSIQLLSKKVTFTFAALAGFATGAFSVISPSPIILPPRTRIFGVDVELAQIWTTSGANTSLSFSLLLPTVGISYGTEIYQTNLFSTAGLATGYTQFHPGSSGSYDAGNPPAQVGSVSSDLGWKNSGINPNRLSVPGGNLAFAFSSAGGNLNLFNAGAATVTVIYGVEK